MDIKACTCQTNLHQNTQIIEARSPINSNDSGTRLAGTNKLSNIAKVFMRSFAPRNTLKPKLDEQGLISVSTDDGFQVKFSGKHQELKISSPDGKTTRIWGDPHVVESDGDKWDFFNNSSFVFGDNKITIETVDLGNGTSLVGTVNIYNDKERLSLTNIDQDEPLITSWNFDAKTHDSQLNDGDIYDLKLEANGTEEWVLRQK